MIQTEDLGKQFGGYWAVDGVTLDVQPGHVLALLGQNGAGKTTTVRLLTAVLAPSRGRAYVAGLDVTQFPDQVRSQVGVLTEQHGLYLRMTANEYLDFYGQVYGLAAERRLERSRDLLEYFGLSRAADQPMGQYSKGMRQKLALARTLMHEPPVLLLDEPTSAMDPESARLVRDEIARLKSSQRTIVICTHNLFEAEVLADMIAIIYKGRILMIGTLDELKQKVLGVAEYEARLSSDWNGDGLNFPSGVTLMERSASSLRFRVERPLEANPRLMQELMSKHAPLMAFQEVPRSLEQVYLKVMTDAQTLHAEATHA